MKKNIFLFLSCVAALCGAVWYTFHTGILMIHFQPRTHYTVEKSDKKKITICWYNDNAQKMEEKIDIIWSTTKHETLKTVLTTWLVFMQEEGYIPHTSKLQNSALAPLNNELFISFSESIFNNNDSIIKKWHVLEGFFATIKPLFPEVAHIRLLVKDKPLYDNDIDCTTSLPVASHLHTYQTSAPREKQNQQSPKLIILHPQGDKQETGHIIHQEFERTYTRYITEIIRDMLQKTGHYTVMITHDIGQCTDQEQCATLTNRLNASLYVHLTCFQTERSIPEVSCYFPLYNPTTDFWVKKREPLALISLRAAYIQNINQSLMACMHLSHNLKKNAQHSLIINNYYGLPLMACMGITTPSIVIECGIPSNEHNATIADALAEALMAL